MKFAKFEPDMAGQWDDLVTDSDDGWLFGLSRWLRKIVSVPVWGFEDLSFAAIEDGRMVAAVPLQMTLDRRLCSNAMGSSGPILVPDLSRERRSEIQKAVFDRINEIAVSEGAASIEISASPLSRTGLSGVDGTYPWDPSGYRNKSTRTWMLDLRPSVPDLLNSLSQKVRWTIRQPAKKGYSVRPIKDRGEMDVYYEIHRETYERTGAVPHPKEYFLGIYDEFISKGLCRCWVAVRDGGRPVGFMNVAAYKKSALYWTSCCRTEDYRNGVYYLLMWHSIEAAKAEGHEWFECGEAFPEADLGSKERGLSDFKKKFGGRLHPYFKAVRTLEDGAAKPSGIGGRLSLVKRSIQSVLGAPATEVLALPLRGIRAVVRSARKAARPPVTFLKPYWFAEEMREERRGDHAGDAAGDFSRVFGKKLGLEDGSVVVATGSGRTAFEVALRVLKKKFPGRDKVIIPSYGCKGTFDPIIGAGLTPVFADINEELLTDPDELIRRLKDDTLAMLLVHLCGKPMRIGKVLQACEALGVTAIEDHCQSCGVHVPEGEPSAPFRIYAFGMGKNIMATAGGALVSRDFKEEVLAEAANLGVEDPAMARQRFSWCRARYISPGSFDRLRRQGKIPQEQITSQFGYVRMSSLDAGILVHQLARLDEIIAHRWQNAAALRDGLSPYPGIFAFQSPEDHVYTKFSLKLADRKSMRFFCQWMVQAGIELEPMYAPLHLRHFGSAYSAECLPVSESVYHRVTNLPVRPNLTKSELDRIVTVIREFGQSHSQF